jgi:hypothetical protein
MQQALAAARAIGLEEEELLLGEGALEEMVRRRTLPSFATLLNRLQPSLHDPLQPTIFSRST